MTADPDCKHPRVVWGDCPACGTFVERDRIMPNDNDQTTPDTITTDELAPTGEDIGHAMGELLSRVLVDLEDQARQELKHNIDGALLAVEAALPRYASSTARAGVLAALLGGILSKYTRILEHTAERIAESFARDAEAADAPTQPIDVDREENG